jgi:hypothetical protein
VKILKFWRTELSYAQNKNRSKKMRLLGMVLVWQNFNCAVHLQQIVRQAEDQQPLKDVLLALREYKATKTGGNSTSSPKKTTTGNPPHNAAEL